MMWRAGYQAGRVGIEGILGREQWGLPVRQAGEMVDLC